MTKPQTRIRLNYLLMIIMAGFLMTGGITGCKSKKKIAEAKAKEERERMIAKAKADLLALLNDEGNLTLEQKEQELDRIKALNIDDPEIQDLIAQVEAKLARERAELEAKRREEERERAAPSTESSLNSYFDRITGATSTQRANQLINEAMSMFASPDIPVLIIIHRQGGTVDYDRPTTISKYLNYLKDQERNINAIENLKVNNQGKIEEVELIRKYEQ